MTLDAGFSPRGGGQNLAQLSEEFTVSLTIADDDVPGPPLPGGFTAERGARGDPDPQKGPLQKGVFARFGSFSANFRPTFAFSWTGRDIVTGTR